MERWKGVEDRRRRRGIGDPRKPSTEEVKEHNLTHLPYRNWCSICVQAKGKDLDHRKAVGNEREVSEYCFDYCFPGDELGFKLTILSGRERLTGMNFGVAVPTKGSSGKFVVDKALEFVEEVGDAKEKIILKTDQEPSIQYFIKDFMEQREEGRTIVEESPVGSSGSNGVAERGVQGLEGQIRVLCLALQERLGIKMDPRWPIVAFMPEYAAYLLNRLEVGKDGKTSYERTRGKGDGVGHRVWREAALQGEAKGQDGKDRGAVGERYLCWGKKEECRDLDCSERQDIRSKSCQEAT